MDMKLGKACVREGGMARKEMVKRGRDSGREDRGGAELTVRNDGTCKRRAP